MSLISFMSMLSPAPAPATSSVSGVKSSLRSPTSRESSVLARPAEDGRKLSRKEVRSGRLALSSSQGKEAAVSSAAASWPPALEKRGLGGWAATPGCWWSGVWGAWCGCGRDSGVTGHDLGEEELTIYYYDYAAYLVMGERGTRREQCGERRGCAASPGSP